MLKPKLLEADIKPLGKVIIGKNLVAMMLGGAGFEIIDLGTDVPPEKFVEAIKEHSAEFVGLYIIRRLPVQKSRIATSSVQMVGLGVVSSRSAASLLPIPSDRQAV